MTNLYYGIFKWNEDTHYYTEENALKVYMSRKLAQREADKLNETNAIHVVRSLYIETEY